MCQARRIFFKWAMLGVAGLLARSFHRAVVVLPSPLKQSAVKECGKESADTRIVFRKRPPSAQWQLINTG